MRDTCSSAKVKDEDYYTVGQLEAAKGRKEKMELGCGGSRVAREGKRRGTLRRKTRMQGGLKRGGWMIGYGGREAVSARGLEVAAPDTPSGP